MVPGEGKKDVRALEGESPDSRTWKQKKMAFDMNHSLSHTQISLYVYIYIYVCVELYLSLYIYIWLWNYIYIYIYVYIHIVMPPS